MGSPLGAAKYNSLLQGAASLDRLGTTALGGLSATILPGPSRSFNAALATTHYTDQGCYLALFTLSLATVDIYLVHVWSFAFMLHVPGSNNIVRSRRSLDFVCSCFIWTHPF